MSISDGSLDEEGQVMASKLSPKFPAMPFDEYEQVIACDLCSADDQRIEHVEGDIRGCTNCRHRFASPRPTLAAITRSYSDPHQYDHWLTEADGRLELWSGRLRLLERFVRGGRILDVGAGLGTFLHIAKETGHWEVSGTEVSESGCAYARQNYGIELRRTPIESMEGSALFDVITFWHVLEHVPSPTVALKAAWRLLAPGGTIVIAVPNDSRASRLLPTIRGGLRDRHRYPPLQPGGEIHLSHFRPRSLRFLLESQGFRVRNMTVDDQFASRTTANKVRVALGRVIMRATRLNVAHTLLAVAERRQASPQT
jgi:SAM-dependent methyltransferase